MHIKNIFSMLWDTDSEKKMPPAQERGPAMPVYHEYATNTESALCSQVGARLLASGGNAVDAAVAATICIGIVNSFSSGIGGGGFLMVRVKGTGGESDALDMYDFRETAPADISAAALGNDPESTRVGGLSVGVPGEVLGLYKAHAQYGRLPWKRLFKENIAIARGFPAKRILIKKLENNRQYIMKDKGLRAIFARDGELIKEGNIVRRKNYARTLEKISHDPMSFYNGAVADKIVAAVQKNGGVLTKADMAGYRVAKRDVLMGRYQDYTVYTTSLPTAGVLVLEALKILENVDFGELQRLRPEDALYALYHTLIEIFRFTAAKRGELGDPDFIKEPRRILSKLMSDENARRIYQKIKADDVLSIEDYEQKHAFCEDHGTTHLNVVDGDEMVVQVTSTINLEFGAKFMDPSTGIIFNNQIDDFYIPGVDGAYDLPPMHANEIERGKRPFSSAAPVLLVRNNGLIAIGAAGGTRIPTSIVGTLAYLFLGLGLDKAVAGCRVHDQLSPDVTYVEPTFPKGIWQRLRDIGHRLRVSETNSVFTSVQAIQLDVDENNRKNISAASDPRKHGASAGK